jgi:hypothetical protein
MELLKYNIIQVSVEVLIQIKDFFYCFYNKICCYVSIRYVMKTFIPFVLRWRYRLITFSIFSVLIEFQYVMLIDHSTYNTCQIQDWEYLSQKQWATPRTLIFVRQYKTLLNKQSQFRSWSAFRFRKFYLVRYF